MCVGSRLQLWKGEPTADPQSALIEQAKWMREDVLKEACLRLGDVKQQVPTESHTSVCVWVGVSQLTSHSSRCYFSFSLCLDPFLLSVFHSFLRDLWRKRLLFAAAGCSEQTADSFQIICTCLWCVSRLLKSDVGVCDCRSAGSCSGPRLVPCVCLTFLSLSLLVVLIGISF